MRMVPASQLDWLRKSYLKPMSVNVEAETGSCGC